MDFKQPLKFKYFYFRVIGHLKIITLDLDNDLASFGFVELFPIQLLGFKSYYTPATVCLYVGTYILLYSS